MSESEQHRDLVQALLYEIMEDSVWLSQPMVYCDILKTGETASLPYLIGGNRPDIFASDIGKSFTIIGEAKTSGDIDNQHTSEQLKSYFEFLCTQPKAELWMGVSWLYAGAAMRVCKHIRKESCTLNVPIQVFAFMIGDSIVRRKWRE